MLKVLSKNVIVTSIPVTEGTPFLSIYVQCIFIQSQVEQRKKKSRRAIYAPSPGTFADD